MGSTDRLAPRLAHRLAPVGRLLALFLVAGAHGASAASLGTCTILVSTGGVLKPNATLSTLSTKNPGGSPARATITASAGGALPGALCAIGLPLNCMQVSITQPTGFSSGPSTGITNVSMAGTFSQVGNSSFLNLLSLVVLNGTYQFDFDLTATKTTGSFSAGTYQATQTLRCE